MSYLTIGLPTLPGSTLDFDPEDLLEELLS